jgi:subtilisin family serine protease
MKLRFDIVVDRLHAAIAEGGIPAARVGRAKRRWVEATLPIRNGPFVAPADISRRVADEHGAIVAGIAAAVVSVRRNILLADKIDIREPVKHACGLEPAHSVGDAVLQVGDAVVAAEHFLGDWLLSPDIALGIAVTLLPFSPPGSELADLSRKCHLLVKEVTPGGRGGRIYRS